MQKKILSILQNDVHCAFTLCQYPVVKYNVLITPHLTFTPILTVRH